MTILNNAALVAALKPARPGDVVTLDPKWSGNIDLRSLACVGEVVVEIPAGVTVNGVELDACQGLRLRGGAVKSDWGVIFNVTNCSRVALDRIDLFDAPKSAKAGLLFRWCKDVELSACRFHDMGTAVRCIASAGVKIAGNDFCDLRGDGVQSNDSSGVAITGNRFTNFYPQPGDHPDAIQFFTTGQKASARDIVIEGNVIVRGEGGIIQGIFLGNEAKLPYIGVRIAGNALAGTMYNGIGLDVGQDVEAFDNFILPFDDMGSAMGFEDVDGLRLGRNTVTSVTTNRCANVTDGGFTKISAAAVGDVSKLTAWLDATKAPPPVVAQPPDETDPRDAMIAALTAAGLAQVQELRARAETAEAAVAAAADLAAAGATLTSMAKAKPIFAQIAALRS